MFYFYKSIKSIYFYTVFATTLMLGSFCLAPSSMAEEIKPNKTFVIDYTDYNNILKGLVFDKGPSSRTYPKKYAPPVGTKVSYVNKKNTRLESNRVFFHLLKDDHKEIVRNVLEALEALPGAIPLNTFSRDEQLAYWLNLRNLAVLSAVSDEYPIVKLKRFWKKLENKKTLTVAGTPMSIKSIEDHVIANWPRAHVIYGFYNGTIGGPNIRDRAYKGKNVWTELSKNTKEFVNSLRGVQFYKKTTKISDFYNRYPSLFPNIKKDAKAHVRANLIPILAQKMDATTRLKLNINDWSIADLMGGRLGLSSAGSIGPAGLVLARIEGQNSRDLLNGIIRNGMADLSMQKYPAHVQAYLVGMKHRVSKLKGIVTIDEAGGNEKDVPTQKKQKKEN